MTLEEHADAISAAIKAAAADGFYVSNDGDDEPLEFLDLNNYGATRLVSYVNIKLPDPEGQ